MLGQGGDGVGEEADDGHGEHVDACHEGVVAEDLLEVEGDPEVEDGEAKGGEGEHTHELLCRVSLKGFES